MTTGRNLHSHKGVKSPATGQQEVTCFGDKGEGDNNDFWIIEFEKNNCKEHKLGKLFLQKFFKLDDKLRTGTYFRLVHKTTNHALHSHEGHSTHSK